MLTFSTAFGPPNDGTYLSTLDVYWNKVGTAAAREVLLTASRTFPTLLAIRNGKLRSFHLAKPCILEGESCLVSYPSDNVRSPGAPTVLGPNAAKSNLLLYNVTTGDVDSDVPQRLRGTTFAATDNKAAKIKNRLPSQTDQFCFYHRPVGLPRGTSQVST